MDTITITTDDLRSLALTIKDELIAELKQAGMILSENEAREFKRYKAESEPLLRQREVAKILGVSDQTVMRMKDRGLLKFIEVNGKAMFKKSQVMAIKNKTA